MFGGAEPARDYVIEEAIVFAHRLEAGAGEETLERTTFLSAGRLKSQALAQDVKFVLCI